MSNTLRVSHNMEVAHRLSQLPGKCQQIHGHSMMVHLTISGLTLNENGIAGGIDFSSLKKMFRGHIDTKYDHHLHLSVKDESWASELPGVVFHGNDPTVEQLALWICLEITELLIANKMIKGWVPDEAFVQIEIEETRTNGASWAINLNAAKGSFR